MADTKRLDLKDPWHSQRRWKSQVEIKLQKWGSMVEGSQKANAERLADVIEMVDELRKELEKVDAKIEKVRAFLAEKFLDNGGDK